MITNRWPVLLLFLPVFMGAAAPAAVPTDWPRAAAVSPEAYVVLEITKPQVVLDRLFDPQVVQMVTAHPEYQRRAGEHDFQQAMNLVQYFERRFETDLRGLLQKLVGGGLTLAVGPGEQALLIVEAEDAKALKEVHDFLLMIARGEAGKEGQADRIKSADYRGITGWSLAPEQAHAVIGNRLLVTNQPKALTEAIDRILDPDTSSTASSAGYRKARTALKPSAVATVFARMDVLRQLPQAQSALDQESNALLTLLAAPLMQSFRQAEWLAMGLEMTDLTFVLEVVAGGDSSNTTAADTFARPEESGGGALPNVRVPRQIAGVSLYRDLHKFYRAKDDLFPQRTSGLIFFENMMGIFFTGRDLTEEVLAELGPEVRLVVAGQQYAPEVGTPDPQFPGFALIFRMRNPEKFAPIAEEAWQKALGLINFTRGQQAEPGLILDRPTHAGVKYTMAYFSPPAEDERSPADMRFNLQPSVAMPGDYLILSSTDALAKDLIEALGRESEAGVAPVSGRHSIVGIDGKALADVLEANRETLILNNMVEKGHERQQAEDEIGMLLAIVNSVAHLKVAAGDEAFQKLTIELRLDVTP